MILSMGGHDYIHIRGLRETSFYIPGRLTRQFNIFLDTSLYLGKFSSTTFSVTPRLDATLRGFWITRYTRQFHSAECGITSLMRADIVLSIWARIRGCIEHDPKQMRWFQYFDDMVSDQMVMSSYHVLEEAHTLSG